MNVGYIISHQISLITQHDSSRLGFPTLITTLCKAKGVTSDSRTLESLSPAINIAYMKKNCWNLDDPTVTFRGPRKAKGKRFEAPPSSEVPPTTSVPSSVPASSAPALPAPLPAQLPASIGPLSFTSETLHAMMQSLHRGQVIMMQSLGIPSIMSMEEFHTQVAWPGVQPSLFGGGGAFAAQEPGPIEEHTPVAEDEHTPPEPFSFASNLIVAQEEVPSPKLMLEPSSTPIFEDIQPSASALEAEQHISQDLSAAPVLDLNKHADDHH